MAYTLKAGVTKEDGYGNTYDSCYKELPRKPRMLASGMNW